MRGCVLGLVLYFILYNYVIRDPNDTNEHPNYPNINKIKIILGAFGYV